MAMPGALADTPGSTPPARVQRRGEERDNDSHAEASEEGGYDRPDQVFDLSMDEFDDNDVLLDWEVYAGMRRYKCCGWDVTWLAKRALPPGVRPRLYRLAIQTDLKPSHAVNGSVEIELDVEQPMHCVVLHASDMDITHAALLEPEHTHGTWTASKDREQLTVTFPRPLPQPRATIALHFNYTLSESLDGFYHSNYTDPNGVNHMLAGTQFQSQSARRAFPCFDEPALKAEFEVEFVSPPGVAALSNTREVGEPAAAPGGLVRHKYERTPAMSTYLVALVAGNLTSVNRSLPHPDGGEARLVRVWGTPDRGPELGLALNMSAAVLPAYEAMTGVPFALPKLDLVALPNFQGGGMENWGLILFPETSLLAGNASGIQQRRDVGEVVAHELAHMWFGDLVTMGAWGELWLNEGFATYFEALGATAAAPDLPYLDGFAADTASVGLTADARNESTHALSQLSGVDTSDEIEALFDAVTYQKGAAVLRMLRAYLTRNAAAPPLMRRSLSQAHAVKLGSPAGDAFLKGVGAYLRGHEFGSVTAKDLWAALSQACGHNVSGWMQQWTYAPGFPVLNATLGADGKLVHVTQAPFTVAGVQRCGKGPGERPPWWVPLAVTTAGAPDKRAWYVVEECQPAAKVASLAEGEWVKLNSHQTGAFRVAYSAELWARLAAAAAISPRKAPAPKQAGVPGLPPADMAGLLDDAWALALAGGAPVAAFLNLTRALGQRKQLEYAPWAVAAPLLLRVRALLTAGPAPSGCAAAWRDYVRNNVTMPWVGGERLATGAALRLGLSPGELEGAPGGARLARPLVLGTAGEFGHGSIEAEAAVLLKAAANGGAVDADVREVAYSLAVARGGASAYEAMYSLYKSASAADEQARALKALAFAELPELVQRTIQLALGPDVAADDAPDLLRNVARRGGAQLDAAWAFLREHWRQLAEKLGGLQYAGRELGELLQGIGELLTSEDALGQVDALFEDFGDALTEDRYARAAKQGIRVNAAWLQRFAPALCAWLGVA
ncbi:hypothetical protein WJX81_003329 [Elliptochloris bilobata]|uniref:Alpha-aminoacylpeptide hydrolase n=1 Tax=Elliptochloris bilobata TaxID=381761 RepID=A0AAW1R437_9CHLO